MRQPQTLMAVHDSDIRQLLESLSLWEATQNGSLRCALCGGSITVENLGCIYAKDDIRVCCDKPECYRRALLESRGKSE